MRQRGHEVAQLEIEWTSSIDGFPPDGALRPRALGRLENGRSVVASEYVDGITLTFFEPDGLNIGGFDPPEIGGKVYGVEIDSHVLYTTHGDQDGSIVLSAVSLDDQQELWRRSFDGDWASPVSRGTGKLAFVLTPDEQSSMQELIVLDLDGEPLWSVSDAFVSNAVAVSPAGTRVAIVGDNTRYFAGDDGSLLDEFVHGALPIVYPQVVRFIAEDRTLAVGSGFGSSDVFEAWLSSDSLSGESWERVYNRADVWCPDPNDDTWLAETTELFVGIAKLADGTLLVAGSEVHQIDGVLGSSPRVIQLAADGTFLASDRGLWGGYALDVVADPGGGAVALFVDSGPPDLSVGYHLRKYAP